MRAARVFIFKATSLPLSPLEAKRIALGSFDHALSVLEFRIQRKRISLPQWKAGFRTGRLISTYFYNYYAVNCK